MCVYIYIYIYIMCLLCGAISPQACSKHARRGTCKHVVLLCVNAEMNKRHTFASSLVVHRFVMSALT